MIEWSTALADYGITGLFIAYLIFDRQILLKKLTNAIEKLTERIERIK